MELLLQKWKAKGSILLRVVGEDGVDELERVLLGQLLISLVEFEFALFKILGRAILHLLQNGELGLVQFGPLVTQILSLLADEAARGGALEVLSHGRVVRIQLLMVPVHVLGGPLLLQVLHDLLKLLFHAFRFFSQLRRRRHAFLVVLPLEECFAGLDIRQLGEGPLVLARRVQSNVYWRFLS